MPLSPDAFAARAQHVRLLLLDVDGVLTDGTVEIRSDGTEAKRFFIRDGAALVWAKRQGLQIGLLSGRPSEATTRRAAELGIRVVVQGIGDKREGYAEILRTCELTDTDVAYMGDDLLDLPILARAGLSAAPVDAADEVKARVHWVSRHAGGRGAVREFVEQLLRATGRWPDVLRELDA